jgi:hypothetical protein
MGNNASRGMSEMVWISTAMQDPRQWRPFTNDLADNGGTGNLLTNTARRNDAGEPFDVDAFPKIIWGAADRGAKSFGKLPDLFYGFGYWTVSARCADVLRQFDLGNGALYPVKVCQKDKVTPIGDHDWFCINFGNVKSALLVGESQNIERSTNQKWQAKYILHDDHLALSELALSGPDIWIESQFLDSIFLSAALGNALKKAQCNSGWSLLKCRVVDTGGGAAR